MLPAFYGHTNVGQMVRPRSSELFRPESVLMQVHSQYWCRYRLTDRSIRFSAVESLNWFFSFSSSQDLNAFVLQPKPLPLMYTSSFPRSSFFSTCHQGSHLWLCYLSLDTSEYIQLCIFWQKAWRHSLVFCTYLEKWHSQSLSCGFWQL